MNLVGAATLGLGLGVLTGIPLGVINVAIVDAAVARRRSFALGLGLGGATADAIHAALAFLGIGRLVAAHPDWMRALAIAAAAIILGYAVLSWRRGEQRTTTPEGTGAARGFATGIALTLPNPGALAAWAAVAASLWPAAQTAEALVFAACVGVGSALWFTVLGRIVGRVRRDHPALRHAPRIALVLFALLALIGLVRAFS
ncbi:MAG: LysE family transporter [Deltaproteobacteria bacterium]|nr:LysE family transporter [Deltaproteobacteria bacterium]